MKLNVFKCPAPWLLALALAGFAAGCATTAAPKITGAAAMVPEPPPQPYMRIAHPGTNTEQLQIVSRKFVSAQRGAPEVWLVAASHIGEPAYYAALQKQLDARSLVLFEGVGEHRKGHHNLAVTNSPDAPPSIQVTLAESLGLVFQLNAINYDRENFQHSDLSLSQIQNLLETGKLGPTNSAPEDTNDVPAEAGAGGGTEDFHSNNAELDRLVHIMDGSSFLGVIMNAGLKLIASNEKLQAYTKLTLIETIGQFSDISKLGMISADMKQLLQVLIEERNKVVVGDLRAAMRPGQKNKSVAIFYGAGHMNDMQQRLQTELGYRPAGEIWLPVFSVDLEQSGISDSEVEFLRRMIQWQMEQLQAE